MLGDEVAVVSCSRGDLWRVDDFSDLGAMAYVVINHTGITPCIPSVL